MLDFEKFFEKLENEKVKTINDRVLIIDGLNTYLRVWSSIPVISSNGDHVGGTLGFLRSIGSNIREFNPSRVIIAFDGKGGSVRRKKLFPEYKSGRVGKHSLRREFFSTHEDEEASKRLQMRRIIQYLNYLPLQIACLDNIEADDSIAYLTMQYFVPKGSKVRIVSTDRDYLQLVSEQIEVYSPVKKKLYSPKKLQEEFSIHPDNYLLYRVVDGDMGDSIPGVSGVGLKTLISNFPEIQEKELNYEYLISKSTKRLEEDKKPKAIFKKIIENKKELERNYKLMQLNEVDISLDSKLKLINIIEQPVDKLDKFKIKQMIVEDGLSEQFKNIDSWLLTTFSNLNIWSNKSNE